MTETADVTLVPLRARRGRQAWTFRHHGRVYAVFNIDGELHVTDAACPHNGGPLAAGVIRGDVVTCPWHWYRFDVRSGLCRTSPDLRLRKYVVVRVDGRVYVELPEPRRQPWWSQLLRARRGRASR
jgi:nitrite reductase/ring-hydroxylating ferredoxin subunit